MKFQTPSPLSPFIPMMFLMLFGLTIFPLSPLNATVAWGEKTSLSALETSDDPGKKKKKSKKSRRNNPYARPVRLFKGGQWDAHLSSGPVPTFAMDKAKVKMMPVSVGAQYSFNEHFSLGLRTGFSSSESQDKILTDGVTANWTNNMFQAVIRPGVHISRIQNWDFYGGFSLGLNVSLVNGKTDGTTAFLEEMEGHLGIDRQKISPSFGGFAGARRVISARWSAHTEVGSSFSLVTVGVGYMIGGVPVREEKKAKN